MKKHILLFSILALLISCKAEEESKQDTTEQVTEEEVSFNSESFDEYEEETPPKDTSYFEDENDYYKAFIKREGHDSVAFGIVYLVDKKNGSVIRVTDPAKVFYDGGYAANDIEMEEIIAITDKSKSILYPNKVNLVNNVRHPWKVALNCSGFGHGLKMKNHQQTHLNLFNLSGIIKRKN